MNHRDASASNKEVGAGEGSRGAGVIGEAHLTGLFETSAILAPPLVSPHLTSPSLTPSPFPLSPPHPDSLEYVFICLHQQWQPAYLKLDMLQTTE